MFGTHFRMSQDDVLALPMLAVSSRIDYLGQMFKARSGKRGSGSAGIDGVNAEYGSPAEREEEYAREAAEGREREALEMAQLARGR